MLVSINNIIYSLGTHSLTISYLLKLNFINLIFIGGDDPNKSKTVDILMYDFDVDDFPQGNWTLLDQKMRTPRSGHAVSVIDYSKTPCGTQ